MLDSILSHAILGVIGYVAAFVLVPILTLGMVRVAPARGGRRVIDGEAAVAVGCGLIIAGVAIAAFVRFGLLGQS